MTTKQLRSFAIHIYNNAEANKAKVEAICEKYNTKFGPLFEAVIDNFTEDDWEKYAKLANAKKGASKAVRSRVAKQLNELDDEALAKLTAALKAQGIDLGLDK